MNEFIIPIHHLILISGLCFILGALSFYLELPFKKNIFISTIRAAIQLLLFGYYLKLVFTWNNPYITLGIGLVMTIIAFFTVKSRLPNKKRTSILSLFLSLFLGSFSVSFILVYLMDGTISLTPARFIPLLGMLLGNSLNGITLGLQRVQAEMDDKSDQIKTLLGMGCSINDATKDIFDSAMNSALIPILNNMAIVGLVSFPGLMTGKILSGSDPLESAKAQFIILTCIFVTLFIGSFMGVKFQIKKYFKEGLYFVS